MALHIGRMPSDGERHRIKFDAYQTKPASRVCRLGRRFATDALPLAAIPRAAEESNLSIDDPTLFRWAAIAAILALIVAILQWLDPDHRIFHWALNTIEAIAQAILAVLRVVSALLRVTFVFLGRAILFILSKPILAIGLVIVVLAIFFLPSLIAMIQTLPANPQPTSPTTTALVGMSSTPKPNPTVTPLLLTSRPNPTVPPTATATRVPPTATPRPPTATPAPSPGKVDYDQTGDGIWKTYNNLSLNKGETLVGHAYSFENVSGSCIAYMIVGPGTFTFSIESGIWYKWIDTTPQVNEDLLQQRIDSLIKNYDCTGASIKIVRLP